MMAETRKVTLSGSVLARCQERERTSWTLTLVAPNGVGQLQRRVEPAHLFDDLPGLEGQLVRGGKAEALEGRGEEGRKSKERKKHLCPVCLFSARAGSQRIPLPDSPVSSQRLEPAMERKSPTSGEKAEG